MRLQVSTLVSTNMVLGQLDSVHTETTAQFQQFQQVPGMLQLILAMLQQQQGPVQQRSHSLSRHSQVKLPSFNSQMMRVGHYPPL